MNLYPKATLTIVAVVLGATGWYGANRPGYGTSATGNATLPSIAPIGDPAHYIRISGVVTSDFGLPIEGATVRLVVAGLPGTDSVTGAEQEPLTQEALQQAYELPGHQYEAKSGMHGEYTIEGIRFSGAAMAAASFPGFGISQQSFELTESSSETADFSLPIGEQLQARLVTSSGTPIVGARVNPYAFLIEGRNQPTRRTDQDKGVHSYHKGNPTGGNVKRGGYDGSKNRFYGDPGGGGARIKPRTNLEDERGSVATILPAFQPRTDSQGEFTITVPRVDALSLYITDLDGRTSVYEDVFVGQRNPVVLTWQG